MYGIIDCDENRIAALKWLPVEDVWGIGRRYAEKLSRLDQVVDRLNKCYGSETIVIGAQQYTQPGGKGKADVFSNAMKQDHKSKNPTTRWSDIIVLK